ncbi:uncharacterized protein LOC113502425 [Trichoplusia ni]|uniref:Uncharacterized protein LOC113502425 n=1 Tax=Trichoplusia ni TaxID=7111 RepID=A0A7E5WHZ9_TRINI|nr:uncharacterized protein LOC113502425 [Trichoplusia ni]
MRFSARLQFLTCLMLYASSAQAIMVKFGTKDGPIEPPAPEPSPPVPLPYRNPAPVWEERTNDTPDPNAQWRLPMFVPQQRYTNVIYSSPPSTPVPLNNAQRFVNSYLPVQPLQPVPNGKPAILGSQSLPGIGLRYFFPAFTNEQKVVKQDDAKLNHLEGNVLGVANLDSASDFQWKYEKEATRRNIRNSREGTVRGPVYQWPAYVPPQHR